MESYLCIGHANIDFPTFEQSNIHSLDSNFRSIKKRMITKIKKERRVKERKKSETKKVRRKKARERKTKNPTKESGSHSRAV